MEKGPEDNKKSEEILCINFNQTKECFTIGTQNGFKIYNTNPFRALDGRDLGGGISYIEMVYRTNILALVGGGLNPRFPMQKVMMWDDNQGKCVGELCFRTEVRAVRMNAERLVVFLEFKFFLYNFNDLKMLDHQETFPNPLGLGSLSHSSTENVLAYLDKTLGGVIVKNYNTKSQVSLNAHQSPLRCLELCANGKLVATASEKGTIVRVYNTDKGELMTELRRGSEYANIYSIAFDHKGEWLACSSDSGTIHIFSLKTGDDAKNQKSKLSFMKFVSSYFDSAWSFAQYRINDTKESKIAFHPDGNSVYVLTMDGNFYQISFDPNNGGECLLRCVDQVRPSLEEAGFDAKKGDSAGLNKEGRKEEGKDESPKKA